VLPAKVPHLLVNGAQGIAVGIATKIPPHNLQEVVAGLAALVDNPELSDAELMQYIPAPDFPTGEVYTRRGRFARCFSVCTYPACQATPPSAWVVHVVGC
jgi:DNA gyrase/topoisomerase IV subunit A